MDIKIILASASPRRKELLSLIFNDFEIRPSNADETLPPDISWEKAAEYIAEVKAKAIAHEPNEVIIGCDTTVVTHDGEILGKPKAREDCRRMLRKLSGCSHHVITGVCIIFGDNIRTFSADTLVTFDSLTDEEIENYMDTNEPFDKAGGYGIQGKGGVHIVGIEGDYFNVVGLPVNSLYKELKRMNIIKA